MIYDRRVSARVKEKGFKRVVRAAMFSAQEVELEVEDAAFLVGTDENEQD